MGLARRREGFARSSTRGRTPLWSISAWLLTTRSISAGSHTEAMRANISSSKPAFTVSTSTVFSPRMRKALYVVPRLVR